MSACSTSVCELTETNSPVAIDNAPPANPAILANSIESLKSLAAATQIAKKEMNKIPSFASNTAARNQLLRWI